jgi:Calcineurin-like phosphoesterase
MFRRVPGGDVGTVAAKNRCGKIELSKPPRHAALCLLFLGGLLVLLSLPASVGLAAGTADEVHYTLTGANSVAFDWRGTATDIRYGPTASYGSTATAHTPTPLPFSSSGPFEEVELTGLTAGATYHYSIGGGPDQTFVTAPTSGFRFDVEADVGDSTSYKSVAPIQAQIAADHPALVLVAGDLTYGNAHGQAVVDQHFNDVMAWSQQAAYMAGWGNHEWDSSGDDLRNYKGRFAVPHPQTSSTAPAAGCCGEDWGWFDAGGVRFIAYPEPYASGTWLEWQSKADAIFAAAQADASIHFIVTYGHRPAYSTGHHPGDTKLAGILDTFGDRYSKYVLNLNGHSHDYERFQPIHGVTHITASGGGATLETPWTSTDPRTVLRAMHEEHVRVDVSASSMRIESVCGPATSNDDITCAQGSVIDTVTIGTGSPPPALDHIVIGPASATIAAGGSQIYTAQGLDASGNSLGDVTASTVFSIGPNGSCSGNVCTASVAGSHTVTGNDSGKTSTASLAVTSGSLDHLALSPASATISSGGSQTYTAQGRDKYDNSLGDVTSSTVFSISPNGSCSGATCTAPSSGAHTVTGTDAGKTGTATLQVNSAGTLDHIVIGPASATIAAGGSQTYTAQGFDSSNNSLGDVTASTVFSIAPDGSCSGNVCTATVGGPHTVTGNDSGKTSTAALAVSFVGNPGFETNTTGWNVGSSTEVTLARVAGGHSGGWAAQLTNTGTSATSCVLNDSPSWVRTTSAGTYTGSVWVKGGSAATTLTLWFREWAPSGARLGVAASHITLTTAWQPVTVSYTIASPGSTLDFQAFVDSAPPGTCFYADDATIVRS